MKKQLYFSTLLAILAGAFMLMSFSKAPRKAQKAKNKVSANLDKPYYLVKNIYIADPSAHVFNGKIYVYPSHDIKTNIPPDNQGNEYAMRDYHVFSMDSIHGKVTDHGVALSMENVPWVGKQMWAPDAAKRNGKYYLYFPAKDKNDIFRIGVAVSNNPTGPFKAEPAPIRGSFSIDPAVFKDTDGQFYMYFGGIWGGQLQRYRNGKAINCGKEPADNQPELGPQVARLSKNMLQFAEPPRTIKILNKDGRVIRAGNHKERFFEASWMFKRKGVYYFVYSTGDTHLLVYATGHNPYGPFTYQGVVLTPVVGWTTHCSTIHFRGKWYLFYADSKLSGKTWLRDVKVVQMHFTKDGKIITMNGKL